jgi:hypothetical protein
MIKCFLVGIVGIAFGYCWAFQAYQPLKLSQKNQELKLDLKLLNKAYVRDISRHFIDRDAYKIVR